MNRLTILIIILLTTPLLAAAQYSLPNIPNAAIFDELRSLAPPELQGSFRQLQELQRLLEDNQFLAEEISSPKNDFPVDILWKTNTFVPAGYPGKALPISGSPITVIAVTPTQNPNELDYAWIVEDASSSIQGPEAQGVSEQIFTLNAEGKIPNFTHSIKVIITNLKTGAAATAGITILVKKPEVHLYSSDFWPQRINSQLTGLPATTLTVVARPFYFPADNLEDLVFIWQFDESQATSDAEPNILKLNISSQMPLGIERLISVTVKPRGRGSSWQETARVSSRFIVGP